MDNSHSPDDIFAPPSRLQSESHVKNIEDYHEMYKRSVEDPEGFWGDIAKQFYWVSPPTLSLYLPKESYFVTQTIVDMTI
jgi:hypothetical protein